MEPPENLSERLVSRPSFALLYVLALAIVATAAIRATLRAHEERELSRTGTAQWIWYSRDVKEPAPIAFVATRDVVLDRAPDRATAKVFADSWHVLWVNGKRVGGGKHAPGAPLALYEAAPWFTSGVNRIAVESGSETGVGGLLFSLDLSLAGRDAVVSDERWRVDTSPAAIRSGGRFRAAVWGRPPMYPWGWPRLPRPNELSTPESRTEATEPSAPSRP
ncbi:MAG: hypothetical protein M3542_07890 [Acidobacteriota bacterium]|nr:hypothetical protein [Acidobacteriota bacterium]